MNTHDAFAAMGRAFSTVDLCPVDADGFLDLSRAPPLSSFSEILDNPIAWVIGPPWFGKTTVCDEAYAVLQYSPAALEGEENDRLWVTHLGGQAADRATVPDWWGQWRRQAARIAVWLVDGVDEGLDANTHAFSQILQAVREAPPDHLRQLRLILFTRPHAELGEFRNLLEACYAGISLPPRYYLTQLDREAAKHLVGEDRFPPVVEVIRKNGLRCVAGLPVVLRYLKQFPQTARLGIADVWRGILTALLGEKGSNPRVHFQTDDEERFNAACRIAAVLTLTGRSTIRRHSPDQSEPTIVTLFVAPENRSQLAADEICHSAACVAEPQTGAFRFAQRNVQDWLTAFALAELPLSATRSALTGADGRLDSRLREIARLSHVICKDDRIRAAIERLAGGILLPSETVVPTLGQGIHILDHLEECAQDTVWGLAYDATWDDEFQRLKIDGLAGELNLRLRDPARPFQSKRVLLAVAVAAFPTECVDAAVAIVLEKQQQMVLRGEALDYVLRYGGQVHLKELETPIAKDTDGSDEAASMRSRAILALYERGYWPIWRAALHAPSANLESSYATRSLTRRLVDAMTIEDARQLLPHLRRLYDRASGQDRNLPELVEKVVELISTAESPSGNDVDELVEFAIRLVDDSQDDAGAFVTARAIGLRLCEMPRARRRLYAHDVSPMEPGEQRQRIAAWNLLKPEDWSWLRDMALTEWAGILEVWDDAYNLAREAQKSGSLRESEWGEFLALMDVHAPGRREQLETRVQQWQEREAARTEDRERRAPRIEQPLNGRLEQILGDSRMSDVDRMRTFGLVAFSGALGINRQITGEWDDLPDSLKLRVWDACRRGLEEGMPTPISATGPFSGAVLGEGAAFSEVALSERSAGWLSESLIERWLPTALFSELSDASGWGELIRECWAASQPGTENALLHMIKDEVSRREQPFAIRQIPSACWSNAMTELVASLVKDDSVRPRGRGELLEQLAERDAPRAQPIAAEWASRAISESAADELRIAGRNVLLRLAPFRAIALIETDFEFRKAQSLEELSALTGWPDESRAPWKRWPTEAIQKLGILLLRAYPPAADPDFQGGSVSREQELRWLRGHVVEFAWQQAVAGNPWMIESFTQIDETVRELVRSRRASERAATVLRRMELPDDAVATLTVDEAVKLLDRAEYRLIRSTEDLFDALCEVLGTIEDDIGNDLPMLYHPRDRPAPEPESLPAIAERRHLPEDALQAYVRRRLDDLLPRFVHGATVKLVREDQIERRQRLDIRVIAPRRATGQLVQVVIEIKWSDNSDVRDALAAQLGNRYMRAEGLTHGIYLVGWCGHWTVPHQTQLGRTNIEHLRQFLADAADKYCAIGQEGEGLRIAASVLDARWRVS